MSPYQLISVICPIYNEEKNIQKCIDSVIRQDYPKDRLEVLFVDGMSTDCTRSIILNNANTYTFIKLLNNTNKIVPSGMNIGIKKSKGDIIIRIDAHAIYPSNYFSALCSYLHTLNADNVGGVCITLPIKNTSENLAIALALSDRFGMGNSYFRIGEKKIKKVDTVPFGCFKRSLFDKIGFYDEELIRNQDDEFNARIIKNGGSIYLIPAIKTNYYARDSISKIRNMFYQYGLFKPLVNKKIGQLTTIRQLFPALFVLGLVIGGVLSFFSIYISIVFFSIISIYLFLSLLFSIRASIKEKKYQLFLLLSYIFFNIHISYGFGYWHGIFKILFNKPFHARTNR